MAHKVEKAKDKDGNPKRCIHGNWAPSRATEIERETTTEMMIYEIKAEGNEE